MSDNAPHYFLIKRLLKFLSLAILGGALAFSL